MTPLRETPVLLTHLFRRMTDRFRRRLLRGRCANGGLRVRTLRAEPLETRRLLSASESSALDAPDVTVDHVIQVVVDGLRADAITGLGAAQLPNMHRMMAEGSWTGNARTDYHLTKTVPNHTDILTSRPVGGDFGHGVTFNSDNGSLILHDVAGSYVTSVFDVVHDHGLRTGLYASKSKFAFFDRSWDATNGRPDTIGADNGRDKIDVYHYNSTTSQLKSRFIADMVADPFHFAMISFRDPDTAGHNSGWLGAEYFNAVKTVDGYLGEIFSTIDATPQLAGNTSVILTADHGGSATGHGEAENPEHFTIPLLVWGPPVVVGGELYAMNLDTRQAPGTGRPDNSAAPQPLRNGDSGNLATQLLGLPPIDGSLFNSAHDFVYDTGPPPGSVGVHRNRSFFLDVNGSGTWDRRTGGDMVYLAGARGDEPLVGDFNGDGFHELAVHRGRWFFIDSNGNGVWDGNEGGDNAFRFDQTGQAIAGDFNGDGIDEVGVHRNSWFFIDLNGSGSWDRIDGGDKAFRFAQSGQAIAGDFDGDGFDEVGVHRGRWFFIDLNRSGSWDGIGGGDKAFRFNQTGQAIADDFDGDGVDEVGTHRKRWFFLDLNGNGRWDKIAEGDAAFRFNQKGTPIAGRWAQPAALLAAPAAEQAFPSESNFATKIEPLTPQALQPIVDYAIGIWSAAPLTARQEVALRRVDVYLTDLPGAISGQALGSTIWIDVNGAERGWFVDTTPAGNEEFDSKAESRPIASQDGPASGRMDLLTVVLHELGHVLGWEDLDPRVNPDELMAETLPAGVRRLSFPDAVDAAIAASH